MTPDRLKGRLAITCLVCWLPCHGAATVEIVPVYEGQARFAEEWLEGSGPRDALARRYVIQPYLASCTRGLDEQERVQIEQSYLEPTIDAPTLAEGARRLIEQQAAARLEPYLAAAAAAIGDHDVTLCIEVLDPNMIDDRRFVQEVVKGVAGQYFGDGLIWMSIFPYAGWFEQARFGILHEYHHSLTPNRAAPTLLDHLVNEGLADAFARTMLNGLAPASHALTDLEVGEERRIWREMKPQLDSTDERVINRYLFGSVYGATDLPPAVGYAYGRYIADAFLARNPAITVAQWTRIPAAEILARGGYDGCRADCQ